jgi:hypothetical protein
MAKRRRRLFTVPTPLGYSVFVDRDRWRDIIRRKHPAMAGHEKAVRACLASPTFVRASAKEPDVHLFYRPSEDVHLCVVTAPGDGDERFVVTAYFTKKIKEGKALWTS